MRAIERSLALVALLLLIAAGVLPLLWLNSVATLDTFGLLEWAKAVESAAGSPGGVARIVAPSAAAILVGVVLIWALFRSTSAPRQFVVWDEPEGRFSLTPEAVEGLVDHVGRLVRGVESVECRSRQLEDGTVGLRCRIRLRPDVPSEGASRAFQEAVTKELEQQAGLKVGELDVVGRYVLESRKSKRQGRSLA